MSEPQPDGPKLVKPEELVAVEGMGELFDKWQEDWPLPWDENMRAAVINFGRAVLDKLDIVAIIPYTSGPCHRGFVKAHPSGKCPDLAQTGCPYIQLPGCFFQNGAVLVRKPRCREEAHRFRPSPEKALDTPSP